MVILLLIGFANANGQTARVFASVDKNPVAIGEIMSYRITLENARGDISPPDLSDFKVIFGPSRSSNYRLINGQQSSTVTLSYSMRPIEVGTFEIGQGTAIVDGKVMKTEPITVTVVAQGSTAKMQTQSKGGKSNPQAAPKPIKKDENLQVIIQLSKTKAYLGEQIVAKYILLTRYTNIDIAETKLPTPVGFWTEDVKGDPAWERNYEIIDGVPFRKAILKTQILIPQRKGKLTINPIEITALVNRSIFNRGTEFKVVSKSPTIVVKGHPGNVPASYHGAVGDFKYSVEVDKNTINANEAIEMKIGISGSGNLSLINEPEIKFPADFEVYDPEINDRTSVTTSGIRGSRSFQYLIIPRYPGEYEIPAFEFSYFSPKQGKFISKTAGPFQFKVNGEAGHVALSGSGSVSKNRVTQSGTDIRYIVNNPENLKPSGNPFFKTLSFHGLLAFPFIGLFLFLILRKRNESRNKDLKQVRMRRANKLAKMRLKGAAKALKANDSTNFYGEIFKALYGYLSDRLGIDGSDLSRIVIVKKLKERSVDQATIDQLASTLDTCEMVRFAPATGTSDQEFYGQTVALIENIESQLK